MAEKTLEYYMKLPYRVEIYPEDDGSGYTAKIPDLPGCLTSADTLDELWDMVEEAKELWLEVALANGDYVPEPPQKGCNMTEVKISKVSIKVGEQGVKLTIEQANELQQILRLVFDEPVPPAEHPIKSYPFSTECWHIIRKQDNTLFCDAFNYGTVGGGFETICVPIS